MKKIAARLFILGVLCGGYAYAYPVNQHLVPVTPAGGGGGGGGGTCPPTCSVPVGAGCVFISATCNCQCQCVIYTNCGN